MDTKPEPGTWGAVTRATGEEHERFKRALNKLSFTPEEFATYGPLIIFIKYAECMKELREDEPEKNISGQSK